MTRQRGFGFFESNLLSKVGARVISVWNMDTSDCLTNGSIGTLTGYAVENKVIQSLFVKFDDIRIGSEAKQEDYGKFLKKCSGFPIEKTTVTYTHSSGRKLQLQRKLFPIALA